MTLFIEAFAIIGIVWVTSFVGVVILEKCVKIEEQDND